MPKKVLIICLAIALLEGFAGLGIEIYAIRISATYIGSSIAITGVILAMVLIAIATGYWYGGKLSAGVTTPRHALITAGRVLSLSAFCHAIACILQIPLLAALTVFVDNAIVAAICVGLLYGVGLTLGSTCIPLITQFLTLQYEAHGKVDAGKNAGTMVAITTIGSVLGSTVTPILLLPYIGLMYSFALFIICLSVSAYLCTTLAAEATGSATLKLDDNKPSAVINYMVTTTAVIITSLFVVLNTLNTGIQTPAGTWFIQDSEWEGHPSTTISDTPRHLSSCWDHVAKKSCFWYGDRVIESATSVSANTLVFLGGAGMAIPTEYATKNPSAKLVVVDIDTALKEISEERFLKMPLPSNIAFVGDDGRGYLARYKGDKFDFMLVDAFRGPYVVGHLYTTEALALMASKSRYLMANIIATPDFNHKYTQTLLNNWLSVFGDSAYIVRNHEEHTRQNLILCNFACVGSVRLSDVDYLDQNSELHTDNLPTLDKYQYRSIL